MCIRDRAELAGEKMKEINEAYDTIVAQRKYKKAGGYSAGGYTGGYSNAYSSSGSSFSDVRSYIMAGRIADAEQLLNLSLIHI